MKELDQMLFSLFVVLSENAIEKNDNYFKLHSDIERLKTKVIDLQTQKNGVHFAKTIQDNELLKNTLSFYASEDNWMKSINEKDRDIIFNDTESVEIFSNFRVMVGGKKARQCLKLLVSNE